MTEKEIEASLSYFSEHGGCCDCEVLLNVQTASEGEELVDGETGS